MKEILVAIAVVSVIAVTRVISGNVFTPNVEE
jgi:hypothetical protein